MRPWTPPDPIITQVLAKTGAVKKIRGCPGDAPERRGTVSAAPIPEWNGNPSCRPPAASGNGDAGP
ncbi:MAG: hypothetical protein PHV57_08195, partial [Methanomicrobiaceae archaeon]|nr:hypothetical protein [Methanomicrobiaceae archaeon]